MIYSDQSALVLDTNSNEKREYEILKAHSVVCRLSKADKRALAEYLEHANHVGKSFYLALSRLISGKLHYAPDLDGTSPSHATATGGSQITFAIDKLRTQKGRLVYHEDYNPRLDDINMASLLGSTLTGMKPGQTAPFLQADGSFREVHLISVDH
jgi:transcription elongation GreA/GreB family factor